MGLHPQVQSLRERMAAAGVKPVSEGTLEEARARPGMLVSLTGPGPEMGWEVDLSIPANGFPLPARLYRPTDAPAPSLTVYFHGGGWAVGEIEHFDGVCRRLAAASGSEVLSVGYRLAPENPFPSAVRDAVAALEWASAEMAGGRPLIVAGDSSGGNLAAVGARHARDRGGPAVALQVLVYPVTDHDFGTASYIEHGLLAHALGRRDMMWFWNHYVPDAVQRGHPDASPLRAETLVGLPPALVIVAEHDPLRDDGLAYAGRLRESGVPVVVKHYDDVTHGFFTMAGFLDRGDQAVADAAEAIRAVTHG